MSQFKFEAIGTAWQIDIYQKVSAEKEEALLSSIKNRIDVFDRNYSRFRDDSLVTKMSSLTGVFTLPPDADKMFSLYKNLYDLTGGLFTPLIGNLLSDAGYDAKYSLQPKKELQKPPQWNEALDYHFPLLTIKKPVLLDFGAGGKGYLVDLVAEVIEKNGLSEYCVNAGGDIFYKNKTPIRVGLEDPENAGRVIGVYTLSSGSLCGSAGNRRAWGDFTHIVNPETLSSPAGISAVWVAAQTALLADSLATCLFFVEPELLADAYDFEYALVRADRSVEKSANFSEELFVDFKKPLE